MSDELDPPSGLGDFLADADGSPAYLGDSPADIGRRIAEAREAGGLSAAQLGAHLGVLEHTVADWEAGRLAARSNMLARVAGVLGVSLSWLVMGHGVGPSDDEPADAREIRETVLEVQAQLTALSRDLDGVIEILERAAS